MAVRRERIATATQMKHLTKLTPAGLKEVAKEELLAVFVRLMKSPIKKLKPKDFTLLSAIGEEVRRRESAPKPNS